MKEDTVTKQQYTTKSKWTTRRQNEYQYKYKGNRRSGHKPKSNGRTRHRDDPEKNQTEVQTQFKVTTLPSIIIVQLFWLAFLPVSKACTGKLDSFRKCTL